MEVVKQKVFFFTLVFMQLGYCTREMAVEFPSLVDLHVVHLLGMIQAQLSKAIGSPSNANKRESPASSRIPIPGNAVLLMPFN